MFVIKRSLKLNNNEATLMAKHAGFRRVVFNFGLSLRTRMYSDGKLSDSKAIDKVKKVLTNHVKKQPEFAWMNSGLAESTKTLLLTLKMRLVDIVPGKQVIQNSLAVAMVNLLQSIHPMEKFC